MDIVAKLLPSEVAPQSPAVRRRKSPYRRPPGRPPQHGAVMLTRALRGVRLDAIDNRSQVGVALRRIREELTAQLGGEVTPAQRILIDEAARTAVIARATGEWIVAQATLMRSDLSLVPVVLQREGIVANLLRLLQAIGLRREQKPVETLASFIAARSKG